MKLPKPLLAFAALCSVSVLAAGALQETQKPDKPDKPTATPASMPVVKPTREHQALQKLVGTWDCTMTMNKPGEAPSTSKATLVYKPVGELWVASEMSGQMMGAPFTCYGLEGFDTQKKKVVSISADSISTEAKTYEGTYDEATRTTTLTGQCRDPQTGKVLNQRVVSEMKDDDTMICRIFVKGDDGKDTEWGKMESKRRK